MVLQFVSDTSKLLLSNNNSNVKHIGYFEDNLTIHGNESYASEGIHCWQVKILQCGPKNKITIGISDKEEFYDYFNCCHSFIKSNCGWV
jgi:hypothetical protein